jgi:hypothetical protein
LWYQKRTLQKPSSYFPNSLGSMEFSEVAPALVASHT